MSRLHNTTVRKALLIALTPLVPVMVLCTLVFNLVSPIYMYLKHASLLTYEFTNGVIDKYREAFFNTKKKKAEEDIDEWWLDIW
jgi:hypothetical protein